MQGERDRREFLEVAEKLAWNARAILGKGKTHPENLGWGTLRRFLICDVGYRGWLL
jgi:hypothetical protein